MKLNKQKVLFAAAAVFAAGSAMAGTDTAFDDVTTQIRNWSEGSMGKVIAGSIFLVGIATGVMKQSIMAVVPGVAAAMALNYAPSIIEGLLTATI
jgi:conjugal transfer pilus assembly protein TraA